MQMYACIYCSTLKRISFSTVCPTLAIREMGTEKKTNKQKTENGKIQKRDGKHNPFYPLVKRVVALTKFPHAQIYL